MAVRADGEAVRAVVTFAPPAIENAQVEAAVTAGLLSARPRSFERPARIIQPDVAARHHLACDVHVIIFDKHDITLELAEFAQVNDVLDELFPFVVARMGLAGVDELHRSLAVVHETDDLFIFLENERRAFVSGKSPRKTDRQRIRIQQLVERDEVALAQALALQEQAAPSEFNQLAAQLITQGPDFFVRDEGGIGHTLPELVAINDLLPGLVAFAEPEGVAFAKVFRAFAGGDFVGQLLAPETAHRTFHPAHEMD